MSIPDPRDDLIASLLQQAEETLALLTMEKQRSAAAIRERDAALKRIAEFARKLGR